MGLAAKLAAAEQQSSGKIADILLYSTETTYPSLIWKLLWVQPSRQMHWLVLTKHSLQPNTAKHAGGICRQKFDHSKV